MAIRLARASTASVRARSLAGRTFDEWHQFLKARGGVALLKV